MYPPHQGKSYYRDNGGSYSVARCNQQGAPYEPSGGMPLRVSVAKVYVQMSAKQLLPVPGRMRENPGKRDQNRYCEYHREHEHDTNECRILKMKIEKLIQCGYLKEFTGGRTYEERPQGRSLSPPRSCSRTKA
ncbi:hypothetical protein LIER_02253 [Lithospermum erythrorhizon]|uniref:Uncharacterized protein n=1 Tax=Lithospermum erythrorhizon TaxID=34254 RepID=A0AAV3NQB2_LITER